MIGTELYIRVASFGVAEVVAVIEESLRLTRARLRTELREIDAQIEQIRAEDRLFRRYGFGSDVHEIQLVALRAQRQELLARIAQAEKRGGFERSSQRRLGAWLLLPPALLAMFIRTVFEHHDQAPRPA